MKASKVLYYWKKHSLNIAATNIFYNRLALSGKRKAVELPQGEVEKFEKTIEDRAAFNEKYRKINPELYSQYESKLETFKNENTFLFEEEPDALWEDLLFCKRAYGHNYEDYFEFQLRGKSPEERKSYMSFRDVIEYTHLVNGMVAKKYLENKALTYQKFKSFFQRDCLMIKKNTDEATFQRFVERHPRFMEKDVFLSFGSAVRLVDLEKDGVDPHALYQSYHASGRIMLEEVIQQDASLAKFNASSVNTVRAVTFKTKQGIQFPYSFFRVGRAGSVVDNAVRGGLFVGVDPKTGTTNTDGIYWYGKTESVHPDSKQPFQGFRFPDWDALLDLVNQASGSLKYVHYVGWDLAYTPKGWVIVEGNSSPHPTQQGALGYGIKDAFYAYKEQMPFKGRGR